MRVFLNWRMWINAGVVCLPCLLSTGCQSTGPGSNWMSWMKPKPSSAALASSVPTKPSVSSLPPPSATTNPSGAGFGTGANLASGTGSSPAAPAGSHPANGYHTGPYGMAGTAPNTQPASAYAANGYGASTTPAAQTAAAPYGGYQSPYQQQNPQAAGGYRTADTRKPTAGAAAGAYGSQPASAPASNWNNDQWGRSEPRGVYQPAGYSEGNTSTAGTWSPPATAEATAGGYQDRYGSASATAPASAPATMSGAAGSNNGSYRPGSTGRSPGTLPGSTDANAVGLVTNNAYPVPAAASQGSTYPTTTYPTTAYPTTDSGAARPANPSAYGGGYNYPSTATSR